MDGVFGLIRSPLLTSGLTSMLYSRSWTRPCPTTTATRITWYRLRILRPLHSPFVREAAGRGGGERARLAYVCSRPLEQTQ